MQGFIGIKCVIRQFLASQDLIVDMILEWLKFLLEVQTEKTEKVPQKPKKNQTLPQISNLGLVFFGSFWVATPPPPPNKHYSKFQIWDWFFSGFFFVFLGCSPPPPPPPPAQICRNWMLYFLGMWEFLIRLSDFNFIRNHPFII